MAQNLHASAVPDEDLFDREILDGLGLDVRDFGEFQQW